MTLLEAAVAFEKILPSENWLMLTTRAGSAGYCLNTWKDSAFGDLHRVYWDETDPDTDDRRLVNLLQDYVNSSEIVVGGDEGVPAERVEEFREHLKAALKEARRKRFRSIDADWQESVAWI